MRSLLCACVLLIGVASGGILVFPLGPYLPITPTPKGGSVATYIADTSGWVPGETVDADSLSLPAGGSFTASDDWSYGEDSDGVYLTNSMVSGDGGSAGCELIITSNSNTNAGASAAGECLHVYWDVKYVLMGDSGVDDDVTLFPWRGPGAVGRFSLLYGNSAFHGNNDGRYYNLTSVAVSGNTYGQKRRVGVPFNKRVRIDMWAYPRGTNDVDVFLTVNGRTFMVTEGVTTNTLSNVQRLLWDPDIDNAGTQRVDQRIYDFGVETFASGGEANYTHFDPSGKGDNHWFAGNAIADSTDAQGYADGAFSWTLTAGTPNHRFETYTQTGDKEKGYAYHFPSTVDVVGTSRETRRPPSFEGVGAAGVPRIHVGSGAIDIDLLNSGGDVVAGIAIPDGNTSKEIRLRRGGGPVVEELTGINVTPGDWYEIVLHHGDGRDLGLTVQYFGTADKWSGGNTDQTEWSYTSSALAGRIDEDVDIRISIDPATVGTEPYVLDGVFLGQRWPRAQISSYTATGLTTDVFPTSYQSTSNMPDEGIPMVDLSVPGLGPILFPALASPRGFGLAGRSGGAFVYRNGGAGGIAEYREEGLGDITYDAHFSAGFAFRVDLWDVIINSLSALDTIGESGAIADEVVEEMRLLAAGMAANRVMCVLTEQIPPIDARSGTPAPNWNADLSDMLIEHVDEIIQVFRDADVGTFYLGSWYDRGRTLAENQQDVFGDGDIHPDQPRIVSDRVWADVKPLSATGGDSRAFPRASGRAFASRSR